MSRKGLRQFCCFICVRRSCKYKIFSFNYINREEKNIYNKYVKDRVVYIYKRVE